MDNESRLFSADAQPVLEPSQGHPTLNGNHEIAPNHAQVSEDTINTSNTQAYEENQSLPQGPKEAALNIKGLNAIHEPSPAGITPTEEVSEGIAPVADFLPQAAPNLSHPTPPPEPATESESADVDTIMNDLPAAEVPTIPATASEPAEAAQTLELPAPASSAAPEALLNGVEETKPTPAAAAVDAAFSDPVPMDTDSTTQMLKGPAPHTAPPQEAPFSGLVRPREEDAEEDEEPAAKRSKVEDDEAEKKSLIAPESTSVEAPPSSDPAAALDVGAAQDASAFTEAAATSVEQPAPPATPSNTTSASSATVTMTDLQKAYLLEKTKNLKKTKHALSFLAPVDPVKLNIPTYLDVIKHPMDLGTLETKLKGDQYQTAQDYANDFTQIVTNSKVFNGDAHPVTIAANNMEAYFKKYMSALPNPDEIAQPKAVKKQSPAAPRPQPRREARQPPPPPAPVAASPAATNQTFALQADGTPQIRRDSTTKRPHRTIKPPQNRELPYAKPKRKEHQLELKFCEYVLDQTRGPAFAHVSHVFLMPVDPVALNIPHYRQIVKKPMDMSTMAQKLKSGQYGTAKEFKVDFELMIDNCLAFNPPGNPVRDLGIEMRRGFEALWKEKDKWERSNKKSSERASSASAESEEESEEEEDPARAEAQATIAQLTKQLAELQKTMAAATWNSQSGKTKKSKESKKASGTKKSSSFSASAPKAKAAPAKSKAPKKAKQLTYDEKQEISSAVGKMNAAQVEKLTQIITDNCEKYRNMGDDMELEIDDLPNDVQVLLLKHVRSIFGNPNRGARVASPEDIAADDDDDFAPPARERAGGGGKRKKHKPMGKREQQESINELRNRLAAFNNPGSGSESPTSSNFHTQGQQADTSGDEESEESEEE